MKLTIIIFSCLVALPFLIKLFFLYFAYIQWALATPIPFALRLFKRSEDQPRPKKPPIGFAVAFEETEAAAVAKKKK